MNNPSFFSGIVEWESSHASAREGETTQCSQGNHVLILRGAERAKDDDKKMFSFNFRLWCYNETNISG